MKTVILVGGYGTRLAEETDNIPKPMVKIGGWPILWHIMKLYSMSDMNEFILTLGYKGHVIKDYFLNYNFHRNDLFIDLKEHIVKPASKVSENWLIDFIETGLKTGTGGRLKKIKPLIGKETFSMTYGDGLSDVNVNELVKFHKKHKKLATVVAVHPPSRFGGLSINKDDLVKEFVEKGQLGEGWINGGFLILEPEVLEYIEDDQTMFEQEPLMKLAKEGQLVAYKHSGFWQCMDTLRDVRFLNALWNEGKAPWKKWDN